MNTRFTTQVGCDLEKYWYPRVGEGSNRLKVRQGKRDFLERLTHWELDQGLGLVPKVGSELACLISMEEICIRKRLMLLEQKLKDIFF